MIPIKKTNRQSKLSKSNLLLNSIKSPIKTNSDDDKSQQNELKSNMSKLNSSQSSKTNESHNSDESAEEEEEVFRNRVNTMPNNHTNHFDYNLTNIREKNESKTCQIYN